MNIKFRVWCKDFNGWEKDTVLLAPNGQKFHLGRNGKMIPIKPENHIVMMWTGLCDRQGKEIYEGDIVKHIYFDDDLQKECYYLLFVKYGYYTHLQTDDGHLGFYLETFFDSAEPKNKISDVQCSLIDYESCCKNEVIGNIFENENLLK